MGAWGTSNFENDTAMDWLEEFSQRTCFSRLNSALSKALASRCPSTWICETAIAAAEVVAALRGHAGKGFPKSLTPWVSEHVSDLNEALLNSTIQAVKKITTESTLKSLWEESDNLEQWLNHQSKLINRLQAKPKTPPFFAWPKKPVHELEVSIGMQTLPLSKCPESLGPKDMVWIQVQKQWNNDEIRSLCSWLRTAGVRKIGFSKVNSKSTTLVHLVLKNCPQLRQLHLYGEGLGGLQLPKLGKLNYLSCCSEDTFFCPNNAEPIPSIKSLELSSKCIDRVPDFSLFPNLERLLWKTTSYKPSKLPHLPNSLRELRLDFRSGTDKPGFKQMDISSIKSLTSLKEVSLYLYGNVQGLPKLDFYPGIKGVEIWGIQNLSNLGLLGSSKSVLYLKFRHLHNLRDISPVKNFPSLQRLDVEETRIISGLHSLTHLPKLKVLCIYGSSLLEGLPPMKRLEYLSFGNKLEGFDTILKAPKLRVLEMVGFKYLKAEDFTSLKTHRSLQAINLLDCNISGPVKGFSDNKASVNRLEMYYPSTPYFMSKMVYDADE